MFSLAGSGTRVAVLPKTPPLKQKLAVGQQNNIILYYYIYSEQYSVDTIQSKLGPFLEPEIAGRLQFSTVWQSAIST